MLDSTTATQARNNGAQPDASPQVASNGYPDLTHRPAHLETPRILAPHHRDTLENESGISPDVIDARQPFTVYDSASLFELGFSKSQSRAASKEAPVLVFPLYGHSGVCAGYVMRPDIPLKSREGKKYELPQGTAPVLDIARSTLQYIDDPKVPLFITEGAKKADCAASHGLCAININGVYAFRGKNAKGGLTALADWESIAIKGRTIYIVFDSDVMTKPAVESALRRLWAFLKERGAVVKVVYLPEGPNNGEKTGLDDFFVRGGTREELYELARELPSEAESRRLRKEARDKIRRADLEATGLPIIETGNQQLETQIRAISHALGLANIESPHLFHGAQGLSRVTTDKNGRAVIVPASTEIVQDAAAKAANWIHTSEREGITNTAPPKNLCSIFAQTPHNWIGIPSIDNVVKAPFFAPNGTLCATRGYHAKADTWLDLPKDFNLPDTTPTPSNVKASIDLIVDFLLKEVAFADDASRCHAVAQMLLPLVRRMINDCTPIHLWDAPIQSSGKSYGAEVCIKVYEEPDSMDEIADEAEWSKSIFSRILEGRGFLFFDNIKGRLASSSLASYVTSKSKSGRILGANRMATVSTLGTVWVATSNNARLDGDARSRALLIRLDTGLEQPEDKQYTCDPKAFIEENRAEVLGALITIVRHWQNEGAPLYTGGKSRFKEWAEVIGGILGAAGIRGFLENVDQARETLSPETDAWREFVAEWWKTHEGRGVTAKDLLNTVVTAPATQSNLIPKIKCEAMHDLLGKDEQAKRLGNLLNARRDQIFTEYKIARDPQKSKFGVKWRLILTKNSQKGDTCDTCDTSDKRPHETRKNSTLGELDNEIENKRVIQGQLKTLSPVSPVSPAVESEDRI